MKLCRVNLGNALSLSSIQSLVVRIKIVSSSIDYGNSCIMRQ